MCCANYVSVRRISGDSAGHSSTKLPYKIPQNAFDIIIEGIKDLFTFHSFQMFFLEEWSATQIEDSVAEKRLVKSPLIDKYDEKVLFSHLTDFMLLDKLSTYLLMKKILQNANWNYWLCPVSLWITRIKFILQKTT